MDSGGRRAATATGLFALVVVELAAVVVGWPVTGMSFGFARDSFMITNAVIGGCCAVCGVLIARHRPGNRLGWLLLGAGVCQTGTAAVTPWFVQALTTDAPVAAVRRLSTIYSLAWPWSMALFIPLALLHFSRRQVARSAVAGGGAARPAQRAGPGAGVQRRPQPTRHRR